MKEIKDDINRWRDSRKNQYSENNYTTKHSL